MIRVMTYNICNANGVNEAGEMQSQNIPAVARAIRDAGADLVGLNEVDLHTDRIGRDRDLAGEIAAELGMHAAFGRAIYGWGGEYGNALLSRWPMENVTATPVSPDTPDGEEARSVLAAEVATPEGRLRIMCTHLSWMHEHLRISAARVIVGLVSSGLPTVVMGDLNTGPDTEPLRVLTTVLKDTAAGRPLLSTFPSHAPRIKIDYILSSPGIRVNRVDTPKVLASDHLPLVAELSLPI
jgi:endonuclease/exonuclease/phosphatase family metal-dependent hydrolase